jgi:hypothetical protein
MPPRQDKLLTGAPTGEATGAPTLESKLVAVKSYHTAMGLCYRCAGKWSKDNKCPPEILLAVADIWESTKLSESPPLSLEDE